MSIRLIHVVTAIFLMLFAVNRVEGAPPGFRQTKITIPGTTAFGWSLASSGNRFIVGDLSGSAYVFERLDNGTWSQPIRLVPTDPASNYYGRAVALSGDTAVVGALYDYIHTQIPSSAFIFHRDGDRSWTQQAKLSKSDPAGDTSFGNVVQVSGAAVMVSDLRYSPRIGSTYIYEADQTGWQERATLSDGEDHNVMPVAMQGDTAIVTSYDYTTRAESNYVYQRGPDGSWTPQATLAIPGDYRHTMGCAISGDTVVFGSSKDSANAVGAAHVFRRGEDGSSWDYEAKLTPADGYENQYFGRGAVAISGDTALVGGYPVGGDGYAYLFRRDEQDQWTEQVKIVAHDTGEWDYFGRSVAICGSAFIIGASGDDDAGDDAGAVYIYELVPEPSSVILLGAAVVGFLIYACRRPAA
ncbi:MAG: PEP-CTERM sorting domain-containing protein [Sedimentisphaerales bacterium]|nr:PEP-CTERM sorting domain-containing protein [Sedimentisphaerales bacterium]